MSQTEVQLIKDAVIVNADVSNSAAIDVSKLSGVMPLAGGTFLNDVTFEGTTSGRNIVFDRSENALNFADSATARFGTGDDLQIYHNGNHSIIQEQGTGDLELCTNTRIMLQKDRTEVLAKYIIDGAAELYYDNAKKLETTSSGVAVTGEITASSAIISGNQSIASDSAKLFLGQSNDLQIYHNGSHSRILDSGTGKLQLGSDTEVEILNGSFNESMAKFIPNGAVELYNDNTKRLETVDVGIHVFNTVRVLGDTAPQIQFNTDTSLGTSTRAMFGMASTANNFVNGSAANDMVLNLPEDFIISNGTTELIARFIKNGAVELYHDNSKKFETESFGATLTGNLDVTSGDIKLLADNKSIQFGAGADLKILHDGTNNFINSVNGDLYFQNSGQNKAIVKGGSLSPSAENIDLGESGLRWQNIHGIAFHGNGANLTNVHKSYAILLERLGDTDVGSFTSGAWRTRNLNTELVDPDGIVTLSSNQFTLQAGTYIIRWSCSAFQVDHHTAKINHVSGSYTTGGTEVGSSEYSNNGSEITNRSVGVSLQAPTNANVYEIQHRCTTTVNGNGFGVRTMFGADTIATIVEIFKIA